MPMLGAARAAPAPGGLPAAGAPVRQRGARDSPAPSSGCPRKSAGYGAKAKLLLTNHVFDAMLYASCGNKRWSLSWGAAWPHSYLFSASKEGHFASFLRMAGLLLSRGPVFFDSSGTWLRAFSSRRRGERGQKPVILIGRRGGAERFVK